MNINDLLTIVKEIKRVASCPHCSKKYTIKNIGVIASTKDECVLSLKCQYCKKTSLMDVVPRNKIVENSVPLMNQIIKDGITKNDILDIKNFLANFDGDFKKIFTN